MANITISNLHPTGSDLFSDSESYLKDLSESELSMQGGIFQISGASVLTAAVSGSSILFPAAVVGIGLGVAASIYITSD